MGYPMSYRRLVARNGLFGGYDGDADPEDGVGSPQWMSMNLELFAGRPRDPARPNWKNMLAGDMRRLEADSRDERHLAQYARLAGITPEQAKTVLDAFFDRSNL